MILGIERKLRPPLITTREGSQYSLQLRFRAGSKFQAVEKHVKKNTRKKQHFLPKCRICFIRKISTYSFTKNHAIPHFSQVVLYAWVLFLLIPLCSNGSERSLMIPRARQQPCSEPPHHSSHGSPPCAACRHAPEKKSQTCDIHDKLEDQGPKKNNPTPGLFALLPKKHRKHVMQNPGYPAICILLSLLGLCVFLAANGKNPGSDFPGSAFLAPRRAPQNTAGLFDFGRHTPESPPESAIWVAQMYRSRRKGTCTSV